MAADKQFKLPDVGEGLTEADIVRWLVQPGDQVRQNQTICEIETAKALVELPSPFAGVVGELLVAEGATVDVGTPIITFDVSGGAAETAEASTSSDVGELARTDATPTEEPAAEESAGRTSVLVGYGPRNDVATRRRRAAGSAGAAQASTPSVPPTHQTHRWPSVAPSVAAPADNGHAASAAARASGVLAKPPVRKLARDLGVDLHGVRGSGPDGIVTRSDVEAAAGAGAARTAAPRGGEERIPVRGVRKATAEAMVSSAFTIPHVTEFTTVDVTASVHAIEKLRELPEFADVKISPLLLVAKAVLLNLERYPMVNSVWADATDEIVVRHYVNLGIAAATQRGLVVPNIKGADTLSLVELARALNRLAATAREGRTAVSDMQHGTFTITNVGVFGIDTGTPIINPGEAAILAFGAVREQPWVHRGEICARWVTTLAMSFDHRIIDGELGSLFLRDVARFLEDPASSLLARL
ncbi:MAG TPA: dihydrolipoamide acetyltransferase family protein [Acidothermaceae bacterium]